MRVLPSARLASFRSVAAALAFCVCTGPALAKPDEPVDPVTPLLADKGLLARPATTAETAEATQKPNLLGQMHDRAFDLTVAALDLVGVRYRRDGTSAETGFDCSGFTRHVFEMTLGLVLPRRADEQAVAPGLVAVRREDLRPGDLVFFNTLKRTFSHVGIYIGANHFIHAPRPGTSVRTEDMGLAYWALRFTGARRVQTTVAVNPAITAPAPASATGGS